MEQKELDREYVMEEEEMIVEFSLGKESFGIPVKNVNEVLMPTKVTPIPRSPVYVEGITDIRGTILPVVNLARFLNIPSDDGSEGERFIVSEFGEKRLIFHVSGVEQILSFQKVEVPEELDRTNPYVKGIVRKEDTTILLLDFQQMLEEMLH